MGQIVTIGDQIDPGLAANLKPGDTITVEGDWITVAPEHAEHDMPSQFSIMLAKVKASR